MALKRDLCPYMVINPSIEIYLLDLTGKFWPIRQILERSSETGFHWNR